ncbi:MAG: alpha/beta hydrolase [Caldilineaceae bacterium]|nr:alpha/beta hydrolase [Caldilineaceae bacterium]
MSLPSGISAERVQTERLTTYMLTKGPADGIPVLLVHGNVSSSRFYAELMAALPDGYRVVAPDLRGYGHSETKPVDATRGVRDWSDDLRELVEALGWSDRAIHLLGWSLGGGVVMQYALDNPGRVASMTLLAPASPYGFGGTRGIDGALNAPDGAGAGGGGANPDFVKLLAAGETGDESPLAPRSVMNAFYFKPPFKVDDATADAYVDAMNRMAIGEDNYPGDMTPSEFWPNIAPGPRGVLNTLAPTYFNTSGLIDLEAKPPILWVRGDSDQIVADLSMFDLAALGKVGALPGWPGDDVAPPQPMIGQTRAVFERYAEAGGTYQEVVFTDCGHSPHIEKAAAFVELFTGFIG